MAVPNILVPPGTKRVVNLLRTNPAVGDQSFLPGSISEASSGTFSSQLPTYPVTLEGPGTLGSVTGFIASVNNSENQNIAFAGAGNGVGVQMVAAANYAYNPALTVSSNRQLIRGTGGNLVTANPLYSEGAATSDDGERGGQDVRAFLYAVDDATPTQAVRLRGSATGALLTTATASPATITTAADFQTIAATVSTLIAANTLRSQAIIQNLDATNAIRVGDASIGAARGTIVAAGESITLVGTYAISVFPVAGTPLVSRTEIEA